ncbi:hypothetical protein BH10ACI2_BH10ACI2_07980 [soil metagenome]
MKHIVLLTAVLFAAMIFSGCGPKVETNKNISPAAQLPPPSSPTPEPTPEPTPSIPNLQAELIDRRNKTTSAPIGDFDFRNYTYELPRGWQNPDGSTEIVLKNGHIAPVEGKLNSEDMTDEQKAEAKLGRRIGMTYVTTKYLDLTGDGEDEAIVVIKIETAGAAIPQIAYVFTWKGGKPELIWPFRTGDRADGGLKDIRVENGLVVVELYGQDRFLLGQTETGKIGDDREQLCCPTFYTRSFYKWNGSSFTMQGKRLTFPTNDPKATGIENLGETANAPKPKK